jgi:hypothetical protein
MFPGYRKLQTGAEAVSVSVAAIFSRKHIVPLKNIFNQEV